MAEAPRGTRRLDGVDLLRGLAIFFVLTNHVNIRLLGAKVPYLRRVPALLAPALAWNGQFGVQIFFAVSGFLITSTTLRRWGSLEKIRVRDFYRLRFARIAPLLLLLLLALSVLDLSGVHNFVVAPKTGGLARALLAALMFHVNVLEARRGYLPANWDILWSLSVEEMFYVFFPIVCCVFGRGKWLIVVLAGFVALGPISRAVFARGNEVWREYSYLGGMDAIALGCFTALLVSRTSFSTRALRVFASLGIAILISMLGYSNRVYGASLGRSGLEMTILAVGTCLVIIAAAQTRWRSPAILRPLTMLGERSYEVYLTHMFVVFALFDWFLKLGKPMAAVPALVIAVVVISGACGTLVAKLYSDPMNRLLRRQASPK